jgi:hypothetical protein
MKIKNHVTRAFAPVAICVALIVLPLVPASVAGASGDASVSGTVVDASNPSGLAGVCINVLTQEGTSVGTGTTASDGTYDVAIPAGTFVIEFDPTCGGTVSTPDVGQYWPGFYSLDSAGAFTVGDGDGDVLSTTTLVASGSIAGTVSDAADPSGLAGVCVTATDASDTIGASGTATTAAGGTYSITGLAPGSFQIFFDPTCSNTVSSPDFPLWYPNSLTAGGATSVSVSSGNTTSPINASLQTFGSIAGTVTDAADPGGLTGVCVTASSSTGGSGLGNAVTTANGTYSITNLPPDSYTVEFDPSCGGTATTPDFPQWYSGASKVANATPVEVSSGAATQNVNASLSSAGSISGTVTDAFDPNGLSDVCVSAFSSDGGNGSGFTVTSANGTYTITGLEPDSYTVNFDPTCSGHNSTHDVPKTYSSTVTVASGAVTPNINAVLATIPGFSTNTTVSSNANPGFADTPITYYATVTPTDNGGTVAFTDNGQPVNTCAAQPVVATVASCTLTYPGVGSHEISASYTGDLNYASSVSTNFDEIVQTFAVNPANPVTTTTDLTSSANPALLGSVTYTAVVSPTNDTGTVSFFDASQPIGGCQDVALQKATAQCLVISPSFGSHPITANFSGAPGYQASTSSILSEAVLLTTVTAIASSYDPASDNAAITFTATTSPSPDGGTMLFEMNGATIAKCASQPVTNGASKCQLKNLRPGSHVITAVYSGDSEYQTSTSVSFSEKILRNSVVTVSSSDGVAKKGKAIHFIAKVAARYGSGFLSFAQNGRTIGNCKKVQLRRGVGVCTVRDFSVGRHIVSVAFSGNASFGPSYNGLLEVIKK